MPPLDEVGMLTPITLGSHTFTPLVLAPMAGVTDRPFRQLCRQLGAGQVVSEMVASDSRLWNTSKSSFRLDHTGEPGPIAVQIVGYDPEMMAEAARLNVERGADIIDINMGCPAKKVCNRLAGSALMKDEQLVATILQAVVAAVDVPVTLKTRTGWDRDHKNGPAIARIAEDCGIAMLAIHGRTRADKYEGEAEYDTIAAIKQAVRIPVLANGDIHSPESAQKVLVHTGCDGIMIGRGAHGRPWIFREILHFLSTRNLPPAITLAETEAIMLGHLEALYAFYGDFLGLRFARKHMSWYGEYLPGGGAFSKGFNKLENSMQQLDSVRTFFRQLIEGEVRAA
jgi:tRNA-dihydrouridine synthase B